MIYEFSLVLESNLAEEENVSNFFQNIIYRVP